MKKLAAFLLASVCAAGVSAQENCFFPTSKGTELSYKYYDRRGKVLKDEWKNVRWMKFTVEEVWPQDDGMVINVGVANEIIERLAKNKATEQVAENLSYGDVKIVGDSVIWDNMQWVAAVVPEYFAYMVANGDEGPKYRVELTAVTGFPREMSVGDTLPDEKIFEAKYFEILTDEEIAERKKRMEESREEFRAMFGGSLPPYLDSSPSINVKAQTRNRKVGTVENIETPAGTFECYKISYELVVPSTINTYSMVVIDDMVVSSESSTPPAEVFKYADWVSPQVGLVKREKYNDRGRVQEVMILDAITK